MTQSTYFNQVKNVLKVLQGYSKTIRLLLVILLTLTVSANAWGATVTFTPDNCTNWTSDQVEQSQTIDGITFHSTKAANNTQLRLYLGATHTFTSSVGNITSILFTCTANGTNNYGPGKMSGDGYIAGSGKTGEWTGNSATVTLTGGQSRCTSIVVTYTPSSGGGDPVDPEVTFSNGEYTIGGAALDLSTLWESNSAGAVTYSVTNAGTTGATVNGTSFTATAAGTCTVQASQAATATHNAATATATITVTAPAGGGGGEGECTWTETAIGNIQSTDIVVITMTTSNGTTYAMSNNNGTSAPTATSVTVSGSTLTSNIADNLKWNITNNAGSLTIYPNGDTSTWLYCTSNNNGVRVGTNDNKTFTIDNASGYLKHDATSRYLGVYNSSDWRCYTNTTGNTANQTLKFYVYQCSDDGGDEPTPTKLDKPTNLKVSDVTTTTATLSWDAVANASGYTVVVGSTSHNTNTPSITVENLTASTTYKWSVTAKGNGSTYTDSDAANGSDFTTKTTAPTNYTVTLNPNYPAGKTGVFKDTEGNTINGNLEISLPANTESQPIANLYSSISLEGYIFEGWYEAADGDANRTNTGTITQDITFYAHWKVPYTVTFNAGTGNCATESITETTANGITLPTATLTDCGDWVFLGWAENAIASETTAPPASILAGGSTYKPTGNITLYAIYKRVEGGGGGEGTAATLTFDDTSKRTTLTTDQQVWTENGITLTNNKASSTSNIVDNSNPARFYKSSEIIISAPGAITKIVATTSGGDYTTALVNSVAGGGATSDGNTVTITPSASSNTYTIQLTEGQTRLYSITVTYGGGLSTSYYHSNPYCQTCENILTISKGTETNGTFTLDISGDIETCETEVSVVVEPTPANHYHIGSVTATTPTTGGAPTVTDNDNGTYTITYAANSTGASTINVTFAEDAKATITLYELGVPTTITTEYVGDKYTLPSTSSQSCGTKTLVGWSTIAFAETDTRPTENYYELGATVTLEAEQTFYAVFAAGSGGNGGETTISLSIKDYAEANSWVNATQYTTVNIDENITVTAEGGGNTGKYYTSGTNWRLYQSETPSLAFATEDGYTIKQITITYTVDNTGILTFAGSNITSGDPCAINATSATFGVGNTGSATNGQVRISNISVTYSGSGGGYTAYSTSCGTYTVTFYGFNRGGCTTTCGENPAEIEVAQGATYTIPNCVPNDPAGLGRTFAGTWNTQVDGQGTQYKPGDGFTVDSDITLYAQWILKTTEDIVLPTDVEDLATTDIVVTGGTTLTLQEGTTTINSLTLKGGLQENDDYLMPAIYSDGEASVELNNKTIPFDLSVDKAHYYPFAVPFPVAVSDVDYADPTLASASVYGTHYVIKRYDGANRANMGENKNANWVKVEETETLQPGIGYIITAVPIDGEALIRFPMSPEQLWSSEDKTVDVEAHTGAASDAEYRHAGWNFIANPYLSRFAGVNVGNENNLLNGVLNYVNGEWQTTGEVPYVTIPAPDFTYYEQVELDDAILSPSYAFFVQAAKTAALSFATIGRQQNMPALRAASKGPLRMPLTISQSAQSDRTTLLVSDDYTTAYEIGKDLEKMFGSAEYLSMYSLMANQTPLAFCATSWSSAVQSIPLGYRTNKSGSVTIALDASVDMSDAEMVFLYDAVTGMTTNLLLTDYVFETETGTFDARFTITITPKQGTTTDCEEVMLPTDGTYKFIENGQLYINHKGVVYTVEGRESSRVRQ